MNVYRGLGSARASLVFGVDIAQQLVLCFAVQDSEEVVIGELKYFGVRLHSDAVVDNVPYNIENSNKLGAEQHVGEESRAQLVNRRRRWRLYSLLDILRDGLRIPGEGKDWFDQ